MKWTLASLSIMAVIKVIHRIQWSDRVGVVKGSLEASWVLMDSWQLTGTHTEKHQLCEFYRYNPLVLKMVAVIFLNLKFD
ncbi:MAG: hypothetical protein ACKPEN_10820 [Planktothrix sp.]